MKYFLKSVKIWPNLISVHLKQFHIFLNIRIHLQEIYIKTVKKIFRKIISTVKIIPPSCQQEINSKIVGKK